MNAQLLITASLAAIVYVAIGIVFIHQLRQLWPAFRQVTSNSMQVMDIAIIFWLFLFIAMLAWRACELLELGCSNLHNYWQRKYHEPR